MVLCLLPALGHSFWAVVIDAIDDVLGRAGYGTVFGDTRNDLLRESAYADLLRAGMFDGLLLLSGRLPGIALAEIPDVPVTLINNDVPGVTGLPAFLVADRDAARMMTEYLISVGHRRIAHIAGSPTSRIAHERIAGYRDALTGAGIAVDEELIWPGPYTFVTGARGAHRLLALAEPPTAVFAACDEIAIGCIRTLRESGLRVPDDVSVAGYDDINYAALYSPALTTVAQPRDALGRLGAENLVRRMIDGPDAEPAKNVYLTCKLVLRESVAAVGVASTDVLRQIVVSEVADPGRRAKASR